MAYPTIYNVTYSYSIFQQSQGNNAFPGTQVDADLAGLEASLANLSAFTQSAMRSDGALQNGIVTFDSLAPALQTAGLTPAAAWATGVAYLAGASVVINSNLYRLAVPHTSGVFATDLAAGKWTFVTALLPGPQGPTGPRGAVGPEGPSGVAGEGAMLAADNLTDVADKNTALATLGLMGYADLNAAVAGIGSARASLLIVKNYTLTANLTVPSNIQLVFLQGGSVTKASTYTLTVNGAIDGPAGQIFFGFSPGNVVLRFGTRVDPCWWGAVDNDATAAAANYTAIQCAIDAFPSGGGTIAFHTYGYFVSAAPVWAKNFTTFIGPYPQSREQANNATLISTHATEPALRGLGVSAAGGDGDGYLENSVLENMFFSRSAMGAAGSITLAISNATFTELRTVGFSKSQTGLYLVNVNSFKMFEVKPTIGGNLAADLAGILVDGSVQGSTGILVDGLDFFGGSSPSATDVTVYKDISTGARSGGDRFLYDFRVSGGVDTIIDLRDGGGFSDDTQIRGIACDGYRKNGISILSTGNSSFQQVNIIGGWIAALNSTGSSAGIYVQGRSHANISGIKIENGGSAGNFGIRTNGATYGAISGCSFAGTADFFRSIELGATSDNWTITGNNIRSNSPVSLAAAGGCAVAGNMGAGTSLLIAAGSNFNKGAGNNFNAITNSGTGNAVT